MKKFISSSIMIFLFLAAFTHLVSAQSLSVQWDQAKAVAQVYGIDVPATPLAGQAFDVEKVDNETFAELKATFEADKSISAIFLVESKNTWVFYRKNRWWMPLALGAVGLPVIGLGAARDSGTLIGVGAGLSIAGGIVGYFIQESTDYTNQASPYSGKAAVFIKKK